jgi:hypothetical protein
VQAVRLFTHGWDFFLPLENVVYHLWTRDHRPSFREVLGAEGEDQALELQSRNKVRRQLGMGLVAAPAAKSAAKSAEAKTVAAAGADSSSSAAAGDANTDKGADADLGLGSVRTLSDFEAFCGVQFAKQTISDRAKRGGFEASVFKEDSVDAMLRALQLSAAAGAGGARAGQTDSVLAMLGLRKS